MAIDYLIGTLIAASTLVNALALGAFWVTPGLRTTANRFVINLLIVNLVGCAALTPSLFGSWSSQRSELLLPSSHHSHHHPFHHGGDAAVAGPVILQQQRRSTDNDTTAAATTLVDLALADVLAVERAVDLVSEATAAGVVNAMEVVASIAADADALMEEDGGDDDEVRWQLVDEEQQEQQEQQEQKEQPTIEATTAAVFWGNTRHWGFDLTAALGKSNAVCVWLLWDFVAQPF